MLQLKITMLSNLHETRLQRLRDRIRLKVNREKNRFEEQSLNAGPLGVSVARDNPPVDHGRSR
jgi:hypothetical protein